MGIGRLGPNRHRVVIDLGRDAAGRRVQHTQMVIGSRRDAERVERELKALAASLTPAQEATEGGMADWLHAIADLAEQRSGQMEERWAEPLLRLAAMAREIADLIGRETDMPG